MVQYLSKDDKTVNPSVPSKPYRMCMFWFI